jgi:hypothetical protein
MYDWDCNKGINNPNGVFSGVTRTIGGQNGSRTPTLCNNYTFLKVCKMCTDRYQHSVHSEMPQNNNEDQSALIREVSRPGLRRMEQ